MNKRPAALKGRFSKSRWAMLSDQQQAVIRWVLDEVGSLELLARAGCGKTYTLMKVVEAIAEFGLGDVALMAFNKGIAEELKAKLEAQGIDWKIASAGTSHSFGFQAWRKVAPRVKVEDKKIYQIIDRLKLDYYQRAGNNYKVADVAASNRSTVRNLHLHGVLDQCGPVINKLVSLAKQRGLGFLSPLEDSGPWYEIWDHFDLDNDSTESIDVGDLIMLGMEVYKISLDQCRDIIDFDDMILAPLYFRVKFWQKDWILVDEAQDTNPARRALALAMLKPITGRMIFVGDDRQAINGFAGADNDAMDQLKRATNATTLHLNITRRCPKAVVNLAKKFVPDFVAHESAIEGKVWSTEYAQLFSQQLTKADVILCRNTAPLIETAYALLGKGIACRVEGREIGQGLIKIARRWRLKTLDELLSRLTDFEEAEVVKFTQKDQPEKIDRLNDQLTCLRVIIGRCLEGKKPLIDDLVDEINKMFGDTRAGQKPDVLTLMTIHKSKGKEWIRVFMLGRSKFLPSPFAKKDWQQKQEANLEYVGITRAQEEFIDVSMPAATK